MRGWNRQVRRKGFTVIELLVAVAMAAILIAASMPFFLGTIQRSRFDGAVRQIVSDVREARSRAITTRWQYRIFGYNVGASSAFRNQYRFMARSSATAGWPADTAAPFQSATQMAGQWININTLYPGVRLNPQDGTPRFWVAFDARGAAFEIDGSFDPLVVAGQTGATKSLRVSVAGSIRVQ